MLRPRPLLVGALVLGALVLPVAADEPPSEPPATEPADAADAARRARVFARLGEVTLTVGEIEDDIARRSPFARRPFQDRTRLVEHAREMFRRRLLAHAAEERGYAERATVRTLLDRHLVSLVVRRQVDADSTPSSIPAPDVQAYFDEHRDAFVRPEERRASHILVRTREEAMALIEQAQQTDLRGFQRLVREHSLDTETKQRGGDLGFFAANGMARGAATAVDESIATAAFALTREAPISATPAEMTLPDGSRFSVVRLTAVRAGVNPTLEDIEPVVRRRLARERRDARYREFVTELRERHTVERGEGRVIRSIDLPPPPMPRDPHGHGDDDEDESMEAQMAAPMAATMAP